MFELLKAFTGIAVRRLGPEDLPASTFLLGLTAAVYLLLQVPLALLLFDTASDALRTVFFDVGLLSLSLWVLLYFTGLAARYLQTLTAVLGVGALLTALSLPFNLWSSRIGDNPSAAAVPSAFILAIVLWSIVVDGHILSRALSRPLLVGLLIAIAYFFVHTTLLLEFMPVQE